MEKLLKAVLLLLVVVACSSAQTEGLPGNSLQCMVDIANKNTIYCERASVAATAHAYTTIAFINCTTKITIYKICSKTEMLSVESCWSASICLQTIRMVFSAFVVQISKMGVICVVQIAWFLLCELDSLQHFVL